MKQGGLSSFFYTHGYLCASHPVEVLLLCITGTVCLLTLNIYDATHSLDDEFSSTSEKITIPARMHAHVSATSYFLALLCVYLQCKKLIHGGVPVVTGVVGIFLLFSCVVYSSVVGNIFGGEFAVLREAFPFFCLLSDFGTVGALAKFAFSSTSYEEAHSKIAQGVATLGPSVTLNALVGALVIGVGTLSGVAELEAASFFGCLAVLTHYVMFMTFLPACLSIFLEMCFRGPSQPPWLIEPVSELTMAEEEHLPNPLIQQVKVIMSAGLVFVHVHSWFMVKPDQNNGHNSQHSTEDSKVARFLAVNAEEVLAFILALLFAVKYMYLEKDKPENLLEVQESKERTTSTETTQTMPRPPINTSTETNYEERKQNNEDTRRNLLRASQLATIKPRKRYATFSVGDTDSIKELSLEDSTETSQKQENNDNLFNKKKSLSFTESPKWKKCHSFQEIFKTKDSVASAAQSLKQEKAHVPVVTVTKHEHSRTSPVLSRVLEQGVSRAENIRSVQECKKIMKESDGIFKLTDDEICLLVEEKLIPFYQLETALNDLLRAVAIRRKVTARKMNKHTESLQDLPYKHYDYTLVSGACCENVIGYMPIPVGVAGPLLLDGKSYYIPMATTEGCLVASTNRGCRALAVSGGVRSSILGDGMTRGPVVRFPSAMQACEAKLWLEDEYNFDSIRQAFNGTSRFARLKSIKCAVAGRLMFARFLATTGDAMGMNMLSKGTENALKELQLQYPCMEIISLSGNYCTDKKATAMNWIEGRGKSVVCEAIVPGHIVTKVLKTSVTALTELNTSKNLVGSAMAGAIGGFNAHAANIVTALFIATGQDPAQNMESSNCITLLEPCGPKHDDLYISCTMPSLEVGTVGGGTILPAQASCLEMLGVKGACRSEPGQNACQLARIICGTVLAGELSLLSALAAGQLVQSHLKHNRSSINILSSEEAAKNCAVL